ncbi:SPX and EXS domain containing protein 5 [Dissostichus eleginoides]|uniref:SPX and EXS domain containing protein 5 n=1 Tax=Dissostichus eleginoides TaxID=100907 RepID=A0AAD9BLD0_DISEL|nr:SPX and EXS domain containing protein 5 [Dissostichus eleginoides]
MATRRDKRATDACLPEQWRDVRAWSIEKRQNHRMWVADVEGVLRSMERQLNASLEKYPRGKSGNNPETSLNPSRSLCSRPAQPQKQLFSKYLKAEQMTNPTFRPFFQTFSCLLFEPNWDVTKD